MIAGEADVTPRGAPDDPAEFGEWVRPHLRTLANLAARLAPGADRDDIVQDALARAWAKRGQFDSARGSAGAWLYAIMADQAGKARRRRVARPPVGTPEPPDLAGRVDLARALGRLTRRQRLAVECVYFVGLSVADTAAVMRCAEGTVKSTLADARAKLRVMLEVSDDAG